MSKVHARSHEITNKPLQVRTTKTLWLPTWKTNKCASDVKKWRTCNWIEKILDKATRIVNVFLISWFFYFLLLCSISLLVKYMYDFILRYEAWVNAIRTSSCIENFPQISAKPIAFQRNLLGKLSRTRPFFTNRFSAKLASKIPANFPRNRPFFPRICPWKSREIWLFFPQSTRSPVKLLLEQKQLNFLLKN